MGGGSLKSNPTKARKRVEATDESGTGTCLVRGKDGSAFARCEECNKDVPVALISFHSCSLDAKIKMNLESQVVEKPAEAKKPGSIISSQKKEEQEKNREEDERREKLEG